ncbi:unnamed protein product, partial [Symbiodinium sp. KB8]
ASEHSTGFTSQIAGMMADSIVEKAINDRTAQLEKEGAWHGGGYGGQNAESSDSRAVCTLNANTVSDRLKELAMMLVMSIILIRGEYGPHGEDGTSITMIALKTTEYEDGESKEELGIAADDGARMRVTKTILLVVVTVTCDHHFGDDCK